MQRLGQHFLIDPAPLRCIVAALELKSGDVVVEIGAGHGELTEMLEREARSAKRPMRIVAIEKDRKLLQELKEKFSANLNVGIVEGDVLKLLTKLCSALHAPRFAITGNIPYYITGHLFRIIGALPTKPAVCVFTIQREVAERIVALPPRMTHSTSSGSSRAGRGMNRLAASIRFWAEPKIVQTIHRTAFNPPPAVDSAIVQLERLPRPAFTNAVAYDRTVAALFQQPRKTILNNLTAALDCGATGMPTKEKLAATLAATGVRPEDRPQDLSIELIVKIARCFGNELRETTKAGG